VGLSSPRGLCSLDADASLSVNESCEVGQFCAVHD
jgi:hypothetical protein